MNARKWIVTGVTAGVLAGGAAGFMVTVPSGAGAATSNTVQAADTDVNGETVVMPQHHGQPHLTPEDRAAKFTDVLQTLVDDGTLTATQRDTVIATLQAARPESGERGGREERQGRRAEHRQQSLATAASVIGVTADELKTALQSGQSIADVATANGVDPQAVIDALVAEATANLTQRITDMVNGVRPADAPAAEPAN